MRVRFFLAFALLITASHPAAADAFYQGYSSSWWAQIGLTSTLENKANGGNGFVLGIVDTGVVASNKELVGRVSGQSTCVATNNCGKGYTDTHGHGTSVASIAAGSVATGGWMSGVAPKATILAVKIAQPNGSAYSSDLAKGIVTAAQRGAKVINLSYGSFYGPKETSYYSYYNSALVNAVNTAAASGAVVVIAGGNESKTFMDNAHQGGFSAAALKRLVFVGSVNSKNGLSSFSNTPGSTNFINTSKQSTALKSLWIMAPGERIVAPGISYGPNAYAYWSGTSMAAPVVAGALVLLETVWPVLLRNGTATSVIFQSATNLGAAGVDAIYGNGLLNIARAFQPLGTLTVTKPNGSKVAVSSLSSTMLAGGALGSLSSISSKLASYTAFDAYQRNFIVNLSGIVTKKTTGAQAAAYAQAPSVTSAAKYLADGSAFSFVKAENVPSRDIAESMRGYSPSRPAKDSWVMAFAHVSGRTIEAGQGFPASAAFADTLWGFNTKAADAARTLGASNALMALTDGGRFLSYGSALNAKTRFAFSWSETSAVPDGIGGNNWQTPTANALSAGFSTRLADFSRDAGWTAGMTFGYLSEKNGLLGTVYDGNGLVSLGNRNRSLSIGLSSAFDLDKKTALVFDAAFVRTNGGKPGSGLVSSVSPLLARSYGVALVNRDLFLNDDRLSIAIRKPLRVVSGSASIATTSVDAEGYPVTGSSRVGLTPSGNQTDFSVGYNAPLGEGIDFSATTSFSQDSGHERNATGASLRLGLNIRF